MKFGVLAFVGLLVLSAAAIVIGAVAGDDAAKQTALRKAVSKGRECTSLNGDLFDRIEDPYYVVKPSSELRAAVASSLPPGLRGGYSVKVIRRGQREVGHAIFFAIGDDQADLRDFMKGFREGLQDHGATVGSAWIHGTRTVTYTLTAQGTRVAGVTGLVPCGGLEIAAPDLATGKRVWVALAENA